MLLKANAWLSLGSLIAFTMCVPFAGARQTARPLPEYWFEDDEWYLDIQYILPAQELTKYRALKTVEDPDTFIAEFWSRRNPAPGTPENKFREEFFRRMEYAKNHFADPKNPSHNGMQTDRGRIYVIYGPPDRIDQHPSSFYEFWNYRATGQPPLRFQFSLPPIDSCDGSYRIQGPWLHSKVTDTS